METLIALFIILAVARTAAEVAERLNQPALAGELVAGVALGSIFAALGQGL